MIMEDLILKLKEQIIDALNLEELTPEEIDENAPLFGDGLGLDSLGGEGVGDFLQCPRRVAVRSGASVDE